MKRPKITINAPVIMLFVFLCLCAMLLDIRTGGVTTERLFSVYRSSDMFDPTFYLRVFGHIFGYNDWQVFLEDMFLILAIGPMIEDKHQSGRIALLILAIAFFSGVLHFFLFPGISLMGAKGVLMGLLVLGSCTGDKDGSIPLSFIIMLIVLFGQQFYRGYNAQGDANTLAYVAEGIVGGLAGACFTLK